MNNAFLDATLPTPVEGLPLQLPDPAIQRDRNQAKADVYVCQQIKQHAQQQGAKDLAYRADVIEYVLLYDDAQPGEHKIKNMDQLFYMLENSYRNIGESICNRLLNRINNSENRTQCRIFNARINNSRSKFEWPPNDQGIIFGRLPNGDPDPHVVAPDSLDAYRQADLATINAIMEHYGIDQIPNEDLEEKNKRILRYIGLFPFYYI